MCGIAGIVRLRSAGEPPSEGALLAMCDALAHRGPDARGTFADRRAGLAHTRLAILDAEGGAQPMRLAEHELTLVFNGEIFNHVALRDELSERGHVFLTRSDTEVVLHAFLEWGDDAVARFNGQWAIALWDGRKRRLLLTRDPVGILPLYYADDGRDVVFASEVKAIFAGEPAKRRGFDPRGLAETFTFWSAIASRTVFAGVSELPPGHLRIYEEGAQVAERAYTSHDFGARFTGSFEDAAEAVAEALERATAMRMLNADVPVGSYLSGGLDSSLIATLGLHAKGARFHTFSLRFGDAEFDETSFQRLVAERLGTEHHEVVVERDDIARVFPAVVRHAERPLLRTAPAPMFLLSKLAREHGAKVVLTGEGADEFFAGYDLFREGKLRRFWARHPESTTRPLLLQKLYLARSPVAQRELAMQFFGRDLDRAGELGFAHRTRWSTTQALLRLLVPELRPTEPGAVIDDVLAGLPEKLSRWTPLARDQAIEIHTLLGPYLLGSQGDRMLMAHSIEGRFPFLDPDVIALANSLPDHYKLRVLDEKAVLKRVAAPLLPAAVARRKKQPYRAPDALSFLGSEAQGEIDALLSFDALRRGGVLHPPAVATLWKKCKSQAARGAFSNTDNMALVAAISTALLGRDMLGAT